MPLAPTLVTELVPIFRSKQANEFNTLAVLRHGTYEKNLSNLFAWMLDPNETHGFGTVFLDIFVKQVNVDRASRLQLAHENVNVAGPWDVLQEQDTSLPGARKDIADIVLTNGTTAFVVENYYQSDGHDHRYDNYLRYGKELVVDDEGLASGSSIVVMLCQYRDDELLNESGWRQAAVVTYESLISALTLEIERLPQYQAKNPDAYTFIKQVESFFIGGKGMATHEQSQSFVDALCRAGNGSEFSAGSPDGFADKVREQAEQSFVEGKQFLLEIKSKLKRYAERTVKPAIHRHFEAVDVTAVSAGFSGVFQWTVNVQTTAPTQTIEGRRISNGLLQFKFGPSVHRALCADERWQDAWTGEGDPDYSKVFITWDKKIYQTDVTLAEVADGLSETDTRLVDQALETIAGAINAG